MTTVYDYRDYRRFLTESLGGKGRRTGQRGALARALGCQTAFLSQVLNGVANLTLEQAFKVNSHLGHDPQAAEFFLLLVQKERSGSVELKAYFQEKLAALLAKRSDIKSRIVKNKAISDADLAFYYSHWYVSAIHVALSIANLQTAVELAAYFKLDDGVVRQTLEFLVSTGLAIETRGRYTIGPSHVHLPNESPFIKQLHANWRLRALQSMEHRRDEDLHYSVTYSLSREDATKVRAQILDMIEKNMNVVRPSKEEVLFCNSIDFFELKG